MFTKRTLTYLFLVSIVSFNLVARITISPPTDVGTLNKHPDVLLNRNYAKLFFPRRERINPTNKHKLQISRVNSFEDGAIEPNFSVLLLEIIELDCNGVHKAHFYELIAFSYFAITYNHIVSREGFDVFLEQNRSNVAYSNWLNLSRYLRTSENQPLSKNELEHLCEQALREDAVFSDEDVMFLLTTSLDITLHIFRHRLDTFLLRTDELASKLCLTKIPVNALLIISGFESQN